MRDIDLSNCYGKCIKKITSISDAACIFFTDDTYVLFKANHDFSFVTLECPPIEELHKSELKDLEIISKEEYNLIVQNERAREQARILDWELKKYEELKKKFEPNPHLVMVQKE